MRKFIATTTINPPTKALMKFAGMKDWKMVITGDLKTPHKLYRELEKKFPNITYLSPSDQRRLYPKLSELIGWRCIQRRNLAIVHAYRMKADIIAVIDDDNIPYEGWGKNLLIGKKVNTYHYKTDQPVFDPLSVTAHDEIWHRGFPIQLIHQRNKYVFPEKKKIKVLVQADLWDGDPDVDAVGRLAFAPEVDFTYTNTPFSADKPMPFNSQNTFLARKIVPDYFLFPHIGRMDDIWASYWLQGKYKDFLVFNKASVYQERNPHDLSKDLEAEMLGYKHSLEVATNPQSIRKYIPKRSWEAFKEYKKLVR